MHRPMSPPAPPDRLRDPGRWSASTLHRGAKYRAGSPNRRLVRGSDSCTSPRTVGVSRAHGGAGVALSAAVIGRAATAGGVARALAADPEILLMDEPFGALDPLTRDELQREFLSLQKRLHKTVLFVTHDLREALRLGARVALMEAGKLVTVLPPREFLTSADPWAAAYVRAFGDGLASPGNRGTS